MKINKEYKIGLVVSLSLLILIFGINFLKGKSIFSHDEEYSVFYKKIDGLIVGSGVYMRGFKIGVVKEIHFEGETAESIKVNLLITENVKFSSDSKARIFSKDLMGSRGVDIIPGISSTFKEDGDEFEGVIEADFLDEFGRQIAPLKNRAERILISVDTILASIQEIVNEDTSDKIKMSLLSMSRTLSNLEKASSSLENVVVEESSSVRNVVQNIELVSGNLRQNNDKISNILKNFSAFSDTLNSKEVYVSLKNIGSSLSKLNSITTKLDRDSGSIGAVLNNRELYNNLNETVQNLNQLISNFEENPKRYVRFSFIDLSGGRDNSKEYYAVVVLFSDKKISNKEKVINLREYFYKGKYLYIDKKFTKNSKAKTYLDRIKGSYPNAYIIRIKE